MLAADDSSGSGIELVVLVDDSGTPTGTQDKAAVHHTSTPLHLAFSTHVFDDDGRILVTRRALSKRTWPGVWTNSFCGHPGPGESALDAIARRADYELGIGVTDVSPALPDFRYRAVDFSGIVENEICPVYTARISGQLSPRDSEVSQWEWVEPHQLVESVRLTPWAFSPWLTLQLPLLYPAG